MRYWGIVLGAAVTLPVPVLAETDLQMLGRVTAYASYCGYYSEAATVRARFAAYPEFGDAYRANDLTGADSVSRLNCAAVEQVMKQLLDYKGPMPSSNRESTEEKVHCLQPEAASTMLLARSVCDRLGGTVYSTETRVRK